MLIALSGALACANVLRIILYNEELDACHA